MKRAAPRRRWAVCLPAITHSARPGPTRKTVDDAWTARREAERIVGQSSVPLTDRRLWQSWSGARMTGEVLTDQGRPRAYVVDLEAS